MAVDPILHLARQRIIKASADLEVQLASVPGGGPTAIILRKLQERAAESMVGMMFCNLDDPADVIKAKTFQNEIKRYDEWLAWMRELITEGIQLDRQQTDDDREELLDLLTQSVEGQQEAVELGLIDDIPRD